MSYPTAQLLFKRVFEWKMIKTKAQFANKETPGTVRSFDIPNGSLDDPSKAYTEKEKPFMGVLYHSEEDYRDKSLYMELVNKYIACDVREVMGMSFNEFIALNGVEMSMIVKACEKHKERKLAMEEEKLEEFKELNKGMKEVEHG